MFMHQAELSCQTVEKACWRRMGRLPSAENLGFSTGRLGGKRPWRAWAAGNRLGNLRFL